LVPERNQPPCSVCSPTFNTHLAIQIAHEGVVLALAKAAATMASSISMTLLEEQPSRHPTPSSAQSLNRVDNQEPPEGAQAFAKPNARSVRNKLIAANWALLVAGMNGSLTPQYTIYISDADYATNF
jgi:hypothetical protein